VFDDIVVTEEMNIAGGLMADALLNATLETSFGKEGLGGARKFNISNYPEEYRETIEKYLKDEITSMEAIYRAMESARRSA